MAALLQQSHLTPQNQPVPGFLDNSLPGNNSGYAPRLYSLILELWTLLLSQESWCLRTPANEILVRLADSLESVEESAKEGLSPADVNIAMGSSPLHDRLVNLNTIEISEQEKWNVVKSLLCDQRDRMVVWKSGFSDEELRKITSNDSSKLGNSVLGSLVSIGESLLMLTDLGKTASEHHHVAVMLGSIVVEGKQRLREVERDDRCSMVSTLATTLNVQLEGDEMLWRLGDELSRLERLSYNIRLELQFSTGAFM